MRDQDLPDQGLPDLAAGGGAAIKARNGRPASRKARPGEVPGVAAVAGDPSGDAGSRDAAAAADSAGSPQTDLVVQLANLEERLLDAFNQKLAFDSFKEKQIDRLHDEIQAYKSDLLAKAGQPLISAVIKLHADAGRLISGIAREDPAALTPERIIGLFDSFRDEIADLLAARGVEMFHSAADEDRFDARRHALAGTVETSRPELVGRIARTTQPGFEHGLTMLSKEKVLIYSAARPGSDKPQPRQASDSERSI